jgi:hypothetical protein
MNKYADNETNPVPELGDPVRYWNARVLDVDTRCRNANAGGIGLDSDAQMKKTKTRFTVDPSNHGTITYFRIY